MRDGDRMGSIVGLKFIHQVLDVWRLSEAVPDGNLNRSRRQGCDRASEQRGAGDANIGVVIGVVEYVEGVDTKVEALGGSLAVEEMREANELGAAEIELSQSGGLAGVACDSRRTIGGDSVVIVVESCSDVKGRSGGQREDRPDSHGRGEVHHTS